MRPKAPLGKAFRSAARPFSKRFPRGDWPALPASIFDVEVPRRIVPNPTKTPASESNIKITLELLERTSRLEGDVAECSVYRGSTLVPVDLYLKQRRIRKNVFCFDSFEGFSESVNIDIRMGGRHTDAKRASDLSDTAYWSRLTPISK